MITETGLLKESPSSQECPHRYLPICLTTGQQMLVLPTARKPLLRGDWVSQGLVRMGILSFPLSEVDNRLPSWLPAHSESLLERLSPAARVGKHFLPPPPAEASRQQTMLSPQHYPSLGRAWNFLSLGVPGLLMHSASWRSLAET